MTERIGKDGPDSRLPAFLWRGRRSLHGVALLRHEKVRGDEL
jgi:hypothetical protein